LEDANTVLDFILADENHNVDKSHIYAIGHSLGGFVCGQLTANRPEIRGGVLLMPCDIGRILDVKREDAQAYLTILDVLNDSAWWLNGATGEGLRQEAETNAEKFRLESVADKLAQKPLLCVGGEFDIYTPPHLFCEPLENAIRAAGGTQLQSVRYPTDHFFADFRLTVAETVEKFLMGLLYASHAR
jgi:pimeloyl-ACP methyl ester carboxylesterase